VSPQELDMRYAAKCGWRIHFQWVRLWLILAVVWRSLIWPAPSPAQNRGPGPATIAQPTPESEKVAAELELGRWIWTTNFADKQTCRLWRGFTLPATNLVHKAILRMTADNQYRVFLDGREIGQGANWKMLTDYDLTWLATPGSHVLAVEGFNDGLEAGVILGLQFSFANGDQTQILSDTAWRVVPNDVRRWLTRTHPASDWLPAQAVGVLGQFPWWLRPVGVLTPRPLHPIVLHFWQSVWFLAAVLTLCVVALALSLRLATKLAVQTRAQKMLELERMRIARDIHDDLGASLTQLVLQGEVAQVEFPEGSPAHTQLNQLCERARDASQALDEVIWAVNSKRDTLRDFSTYLCKYAQNFLASTPIRCRLDVQPDMPASSFDLPVRRGLFLAVKEALHNAAKHSAASELFLRIHREADRVVVVVEDNGQGFDPASLGGERNGLANLKQRLTELGGECLLASEAGLGCRVELRMPLAHPARANSARWRRFWCRRDHASIPVGKPETFPGDIVRTISQS
jgi:signal transduction histidine kinase